MTEPVTDPRCSSCRRALPGAAPAPAGHVLLCGDRCAPLRLHGRRFARGLEHEPFGDYLAAVRREQNASA